MHPLAGLELVVALLDGRGDLLAHREVVALPVADGLVHDPDGVGIRNGALGLGAPGQVDAVLAPDPDPTRRDGGRGVHGLLGRRRAARPAAPGPGLLAGPVRHVAGRGGEHLDLGPEEAHEAGEAGVVLGGGQVPDQSASGVGGLARKTGISRRGMDPLDFGAASGTAETSVALARHRHVGPGREEAVG